MSKRAEERALECYPMKDYKPSGIISEEYPEKVKVAYLQGYEQAEKDTIDRACKWLEENVVIYPYWKPLCIINLDTFRKAMRENE